MKLLSPIDVTVLTWLKPELDSTLHQARNSLEHYVEEGQSVASLRDCILHLHQVAGILNMVELAGAARLAEEMEQLALCLAEGKVQTTESAYSFLMQCIVQLPDYLERLQNGHRDVPTVLLPLANELRSIRGESALGEESVYSAATHLPIPEHAFDKLRVGNAEKVFAELALQFQAFLLAWLNNQEDKQAANNLSIACSQIGAQIQDESSRKVFWVASALLDAVANNKISLSSELRQAIIKIDQEVNYINNRIMGEVRQSSPVRLTQELLYFVSQNHTATDRMRQVYEVFELQQNIPDENEINHAKSSLLGRNNALFQSVATVIKEDILRVKDSLDMFIRNEDAAPKDFSELVAVLNRIENTLELIDANTAKDLIGKNKKIIQGFLDGANALGESELMAIAKSLLSVELMLDHHGVDSGSDKQAKMANDFLTSSQSHQLLDALIRESIVNFASARQAYVAFVESYWDHTQLATIPALFKQVSGALAILEFTPVSNFIDALNAFTRYEFIEKQKIPSSESMERLAEVLASLEYYLESVRDRRPNRERILEITQKSLEALNYWPVPEYALQTTTAIVEPVVASPVVAHEVIDTTPVVTPEAVVEQVMPVKPMEETFDSAYVSEEGETLLGFDANAEGIDDEIREIFLEEFAEESGNLTGYFESWQADQENIEHVRPIRRIFHTFKGSGRLVGAKDLSDFSWKIESLLNRVLDGSRPPTNEVIRMLSIAIDVLPKFNAAMLGETVSLDLSGLSDVVDRLAAGEDAVYKTKKAKSKPATRNDEAIASTEQVNSTDANAAPSIDPVLLEILKPEVTGHVETVNAWLESAKGHTNPVFEDAIFRAVHTMNGAFAMSEVPSMSELLAPTETMLRRAIANNANVKSETIYFMGQVLAAVKQTLVDLSENKSPANYQELVQRAITLRDELPSTQVNNIVPDELIHIEAERVEAERVAAEMAEAERIEAERVAAELAEAERLEAERLEAERLEAERLEAERLEAERLEAERLEAERLEAERLEAERLEAERLEAERLEAERLEAERLEAERLEAERLEAERLEAERVAAELAEAERVEAERVEAERVEAERVEAERVEAERVEAERVEAERVEAERVEAERVEAERVEAERVEAERVAAELAEAERLEAERVAAELAEAERVEAERVAAELAEAERLEAERIAAELAEAERLEAERIATELAEAERLEAERIAAELAEAERLEAERIATELAEAERLEAERIATELAEAERIEAERIEAERIEAERIEAERIEAERIEAERIEAERIEAERIEAERVAAELAEAERLEAERVAAELAEAERVEAERVEAERVAAELAEAERLEVARIAAERIEAERAKLKQAVIKPVVEVKRVGGKRGEAMRLEAKREAKRLEALRIQAEQAEASNVDKPADIAITNEIANDLHLDSVTTEAAISEVLINELPNIEHSPAVSNGSAEQEGPMKNLDMSDLDEELLDIFAEEAKDLLDQSDNLLVDLKSDPENFEYLFGLQRHLHTIKGGARMAGLFTIGELSHSLETLLQHNTEHRIVPNASQISVIERALDALHKMSHLVEERKSPELPQDIMELLDPSLQVEAPVEEVAGAESDKPVAAKPFKPLSGPIEVAELETDEAIRTPQEVVRIRADLLEQLVNFSGEVAIYRARLEQQLGLFKINLVELDQTTTRLREQLRRLDLETEAQIAARNIREVDQGRQDFDPLELDRFTNQQQLSRSLAETSNDLVNLQTTMDDLTRHHESLLLQQSRVSTELQEGLMRTRMLPFETLLPRLRRVLRQASQDAGKEVQLRVDGAQGEMDRTVLDRMIAPLEHLLRNAVAHGIEDAKERKKAGKSETATVVINIAHEGTEVILSVRDDGRGMNVKQIHQKGVERGLISADAEMTEQQILNLITQTGFTTSDTVTRLAGRGVGMDVVNSEIKGLNGSLSIQTALHKGTEFIVRLPLNLAVTKAVFVKIGDSKFAIPIASVDGVGRIGREELAEKSQLEVPEFSYAGNTHKIYDLGTLLEMPKAQATGSMQMPMLLSKSGNDRIAICVDQVLGSQEIVVKPVGPQVTSVPGVYGASIMPDGGVIVILDLAPLVRHNASRTSQKVVEVEDLNARSMPLVMVVDDSITMRKVTSRILERNNFEVITARDGLEAIEKMAEQVPDLVLLDIEMPRMDGYEVAQNMKADSRLMNVPIMMITSRTGEKHRQRAYDLGVERYLGKPYQELELMRQVNDVFKK